MPNPHNDTQLSAVAEHSPDAIFVTVHEHIAYANPAALRLFGATSIDQLLGLPVLERVHPDHRRLVQERIKQLYEQKFTAPLIEETFLRLDGTPVEVEVSAVPYCFDGETGALVFVRDIGARKRGERALKSLNRDFVTLLENTSDFIYFKDQDSRFRFCSQTLARITGYEDWRDMIGKHDLEVFPEDTARIYYEEELPIFRDGIPLIDRVDPYYDEAGVPGWVSTSKWPVVGDDGKSVVGIFGISRIVTERMRAETELQRLNRTLQLLNDLNTVLLRAEQEESLLTDICQLIVRQGGYRMAWVGFPGQDSERTVRPVARAGDDSGYLDSLQISWADTAAGRNPTGTAIRTSKPETALNAADAPPSPLPWRDEAMKRGYRSILGLPLQIEGVVLGALTIYSTEPDAFSTEEVGLLEHLAHNLAFGIDRLRAKVRLAAANKELQAFTYAASHDLKAPLGRINSFSSLLEKRCRDQLDDDGLQFLGFIQQNSARLTTLVDDLLAHAQVEQQNVNLQQVDLRAAFQAILHDLGEEIRQKGAEIRLNLPSVEVQADPFDLAQVLHNLLSNALKYSGGNNASIIEIGGEPRKGCFRFWVRDNGIGFDMVYRDRIFEIFRRLHTYSEYPGNGIGLALVKKAVSRMKGNVWAESRPGEGATFYVELSA